MIQRHNITAPAPTTAAAYTGDWPERVSRFLPMVKRLAWHVHGGGCVGLEVEDLFQTGVVALTEAAQRHAGPGEDGFAAYAKLRVRGAMIDLIRRTVPASRHAVERRKLLQRHALALRGQLGREPEAAELAEAMGITPGELGQLRSDCIEVRFEPLDDHDAGSDAAFLDDGSDTFAALADGEVRAALAGAIGGLPDRLQLVIQLYFLEELNLAEIAQVLDVSVPRVHQLKAQALAAMRETMQVFAD